MLGKLNKLRRKEDDKIKREVKSHILLHASSIDKVIYL